MFKIKKLNKIWIYLVKNIFKSTNRIKQVPRRGKNITVQKNMFNEHFHPKSLIVLF